MEEDEGPRACEGGDEVRCAFARRARDVDACPRGMDRGRRLAREELRQCERQAGTVYRSFPLLVKRLEITWPAYHALGRHHRAHIAWLDASMEALWTPKPCSCQADVCWVQLYHAGVILVRTMAQSACERHSARGRYCLAPGASWHTPAVGALDHKSVRYVTLPPVLRSNT